jgi:4-hydroxyphenylpyruvate dioxygenase-like putative hemolysin
VVAELLQQAGVGLWPVIDHCAIRTRDVEKRAVEMLDRGFQRDKNLGVLEFDNWWAKVYRKPGYPALFIDQAFAGERGGKSLIPEWVDAHGDKRFHHIAVRVENIEQAIATLKSRGIAFAGEIIGERGSDLRQIFTQPEIKGGKVFTVLELTERHRGYQGFLPPQANDLMESTRPK